MPLSPRFYCLNGFYKKSKYFQTTDFTGRKRKPEEDSEALRDGKTAAVVASIMDALDFTVTKSASSQEPAEDDYPNYVVDYEKAYSSAWNHDAAPVVKMDDNGEEIGENLSKEEVLHDILKRPISEPLDENLFEDDEITCQLFNEEEEKAFQLFIEDDEKLSQLFIDEPFDENRLEEHDGYSFKDDCPQDKVNYQGELSLSKDDAFRLVESNPFRLEQLSETTLVKEFLEKLLDLEPPIMCYDGTMKAFLKAYQAKLFNNISEFSIMGALTFFCSLLGDMEAPCRIDCSTIMKMRKKNKGDYLWAIDLYFRMSNFKYRGYNWDCCVIPVYWLCKGYKEDMCKDTSLRKDCLPHCKYWTPILKEHDDFMMKLWSIDIESDIEDFKLEGYDKLPEDLKQLGKKDRIKFLKMRDEMGMFMHFARYKLGIIASATDFSCIKSDNLFCYVERARQAVFNYKQRSKDENLEDPKGVQFILNLLEYIFDRQLSFFEANICYEYQNFDFKFHG